MKAATFLTVVIATFTSVPLLAQQAEVNANTQQSTSAAAGARTAAGYGDDAASHAWEMSSITGELEGKLDSKTARLGETVVLKTIQKVQTSDGTIIPKGSRLIGHITQVQAYSKEHGAAQMGVAFDRAEPKGGQSVAIYTLIRGLKPGAEPVANPMGNASMIGAPLGESASMGGGPAMGGGRSGGGIFGGTGGAVDGAGGVAGGTLGRTGQAANDEDDRMGANPDSTENARDQTAGNGDLIPITNAHAAASERAVPRPTAIPGILLAGSSTASGLLLGSGKDIELLSGTEMQLSIVAK